VWQVNAPNKLDAGQRNGVLHEAPPNVHRQGAYGYGINEDKS